MRQSAGLTLSSASPCGYDRLRSGAPAFPAGHSGRAICEKQISERRFTLPIQRLINFLRHESKINGAEKGMIM